MLLANDAVFAVLRGRDAAQRLPFQVHLKVGQGNFLCSQTFCAAGQLLYFFFFSYSFPPSLSTTGCPCAVLALGSPGRDAALLPALSRSPALRPSCPADPEPVIISSSWSYSRQTWQPSACWLRNTNLLERAQRTRPRRSWRELGAAFCGSVLMSQLQPCTVSFRRCKG